MMKLIRKTIEPESWPVLYDKPFTPENFASDFTIRDGSWHVEDGWLIGENPNNSAAMTTMKEKFYGPVCLDFYAKVLDPCTHDINCMWSGSWDEETNTRQTAYVAGIGGWWDAKVGFERSPDYKLNSATKLLGFEAGKVYHLQVGSVGGHAFVIVDGQLALESTDPDPIDQLTHGMIGLEAYCTRVAFTDFKVRRASAEDVEMSYDPEF